MGIFRYAIDEMEKTGSWHRDPQTFADYLEQYNLPKKDTAASISIDSLSKLDPDLRSAGVMIFRLGSGPGQRGTRFALARTTKSDMSDYFILDSELFSNIDPELYLPNVSYQSLFGFTLLPRLTESSLVNLAVGSGLLNYALELDSPSTTTAPATGQSVFTFDLRPRSKESLTWKHNQGQVEIDAVFVGYRENRPVAVFVESKVGENLDSLAKHKLLFPYLALRPSIPSYMSIILVYLRAIRRADGYHFYIAECSTAAVCPALDELEFCRPKHIALRI